MLDNSLLEEGNTCGTRMCAYKMLLRIPGTEDVSNDEALSKMVRNV